MSKDDKGDGFGTARIQGRRGNIRAGAVSGPWRSGSAPEPARHDAADRRGEAERAEQPQQPQQPQPEEVVPSHMAFEPRAKRTRSSDGLTTFGLTVVVILLAAGLFLAGIGLRGFGGSGTSDAEPAAEEGGD